MGAAEGQRGRPPAVQTSDETRQGDGQGTRKRSPEPIPSEQHLEAGGVEIIPAPFFHS